MRKFMLKHAPLETGEDFDYAKQITETLRLKNEKGADLEEMIQAVRCITAVRSAVKDWAPGEPDRAVLWEENDYNYVKARFEEVRWRLIDPAIVEFMTQLRAAPVVEVAERAAG